MFDPMNPDPAIHHQTLRDIHDAPEAEWAPVRARVETEGWGAQLLALQDADGQWAGGAFVPVGFDWSTMRIDGQPWVATTYALTQLREFGIDPTSERMQRTVELIRANCRWDYDNEPFWEGEVEECINGRTVADGAYFGVDVAPIVERLVGERQEDGGWNCERANGSQRSSFHSTINVLEGLLEFERATGGTPATREARQAGEEFLLQRHLFRRLGTGQPASEQFLKLTYPHRWYYDFLRALDYFRAASSIPAKDTGAAPDPRLAEAIDHLRSRQLPDGTWPMDWTPKGRTWFDMDPGPGHPSQWITLKALRVLKWWDNP